MVKEIKEHYSDHLSDAEIKELDQKNRKAHWGVSDSDLVRYAKQWDKMSDKEKAKVEYILTDCNFHHEFSLLKDGKADELLKELGESLVSKLKVESLENSGGQWNQVEIAKEFGLYDRLTALDKELMQIDGVKNIKFDLDSYYDFPQIIFLANYDLPYDETYYKKRAEMTNKIIEVSKKYGLKRTGDPIEDYGEDLYFVFWDTQKKEQLLKEEVSDEAYKVAEIIDEYFGGGLDMPFDYVSKNEFDTELGVAIEAVFGEGKTIEDLDQDFEADVRGILGNMGWETILEGEKEGGLQRGQKPPKKETLIYKALKEYEERHNADQDDAWQTVMNDLLDEYRQYDLEESKKPTTKSKKLNEGFMDAIFDRIDGEPYRAKEFYDYMMGLGRDDVSRALDYGTEDEVRQAIIDEIKKDIKCDGGNPDNPNAQQLYAWVKQAVWTEDSDNDPEKPEYLKKMQESKEDVTDQVIINVGENGYLTKKAELEKQGYKTLWTGEGKICMAKPKVQEGEQLNEITNESKSLKDEHQIANKEDGWLVDNKFEITKDGVVFWADDYTEDDRYNENGDNNDFPQWLFDLRDELTRNKPVKESKPLKEYNEEKTYKVSFGTGFYWTKDVIVKAFHEQQAVDLAADKLVDDGWKNLYNDYYELQDMCDAGQSVEEYAEANGLTSCGNNGYYFSVVDVQEVPEGTTIDETQTPEYKCESKEFGDSVYYTNNKDLEKYIWETGTDTKTPTQIVKELTENFKDMKVGDERVSDMFIFKRVK